MNKIKALIKRTTDITAEGYRVFNNPDGPPIQKVARFGMIVLLIFVLTFGLWATFAPLESAALANGKVVVATNRKTIQHLEGGIIKKIFVQEGSVVKADAPLILLDDTQARATYDLYHAQAAHLFATEARLVAQRDNAPKITFPEILLKQQNDPAVADSMRVEQSLFDSEKLMYQQGLAILNQRLEQLKEQIQSYQAQVDSNAQQLAIMKKEEEALLELDAQHYVDKPRLWAAQREDARLVGNRDEYLGSIAQAEQKIGETQQQILSLSSERQQKILSDLSDVQQKMADTLEREKSSQDTLRRTLIVAPEAGTVVDLQEHTIGGVISPGKAILDLVPSQENLIIEAHVNPMDIDIVHPGLTAKIQLVAYKLRYMPWVGGTVTQVSADVLTDQQTRESYYTAYITIPKNELKELKNVRLYPGMPVTAMIITDKRTPWQYFFSPLLQSFQRAFREQ